MTGLALVVFAINSFAVAPSNAGVQPPAQPVGCNALFYGWSATEAS